MRCRARLFVGDEELGGEGPLIDVAHPPATLSTLVENRRAIIWEPDALDRAPCDLVTIAEFDLVPMADERLARIGAHERMYRFARLRHGVDAHVVVSLGRLVVL